MNVPNRKTIRTARRKRMAELIRGNIQAGKAELSLREIQPQFFGITRFPRLSSLHAFVDHQYLTAPHPGNRGHFPRVIKLDSIAKRYADEILGSNKYIDQPDGTPIGDIIFSLTA
ncbi:MAG: hypothetical protein JEY79_11230 [Pseudodesulfovibrio sp.]|nr:hypothetical protein [Pseudodesulfovibrio sp.]